MNIKSNYMNYFRNGKLYQWDKNRDVFVIADCFLNVNDNSSEYEFCIDQKGMDTLLKYEYASHSTKIKVGKVLVIEDGKKRSEIKIVGTPLLLPNMKFDTEFVVDVEKIKTASKFVAKTNQKPVLTGVHIENNYVFATDSYFAYRTQCECNCNVTISDRFILALKDLSGRITMKVNKNTIACETDNTLYIGKLLDGVYPPLNKLYDTYITAGDKHVEASVEEFKDYMSFADKSEDYVVLTENRLKICGVQDFEGVLTANFPCKVTVACGRLNTIINNVSTNTLNILYSTGEKPLIINNEYLILPVKRDQ